MTLDGSALAVMLNALALLGVVWRGSSIVTELRKDVGFQTKAWEQQIVENRVQQEARLQHAVIMERVTGRLDAMEARHDRAEFRLAVLEGHKASAM